MDFNELVTIKDFDFEKNRFWSSPERLPHRNVIGVVLNNPTLYDVTVLCKRYGVELIKQALERMIEKNELKQAQAMYCKEFINKYEN